MLDKRVSDASIRLDIMLRTCIDMFENSDAGNFKNVCGNGTRSEADAGVSACIDCVSLFLRFYRKRHEHTMAIFTRNSFGLSKPGERQKQADAFRYRFSFP